MNAVSRKPAHTVAELARISFALPLFASPPPPWRRPLFRLARNGTARAATLARACVLRALRARAASHSHSIVRRRRSGGRADASSTLRPTMRANRCDPTTTRARAAAARARLVLRAPTHVRGLSSSSPSRRRRRRSRRRSQRRRRRRRRPVFLLRRRDGRPPTRPRPARRSGESRCRLSRSSQGEAVLQRRKTTKRGRSSRGKRPLPLALKPSLSLTRPRTSRPTSRSRSRAASPGCCPSSWGGGEGGGGVRRWEEEERGGGGGGGEEEQAHPSGRWRLLVVAKRRDSCAVLIFI